MEGTAQSTSACGQESEGKDLPSQVQNQEPLSQEQKTDMNSYSLLLSALFILVEIYNNIWVSYTLVFSFFEPLYSFRLIKTRRFNEFHIR